MNVELATGLLDGMGLRVPSKLIDFGRALASAYEGGDSELDWPYFLEKPYKWSVEYTSWVNYDYPQRDDGDAWECFLSDLPEA